MDRRVPPVVLAMVMSVSVIPALAARLFETDFESASKTARDTNRYMLLDFSGSDWCGWCIRLDKEVFSKKDFTAFAEDNLVCVMLDFPRRKTLKKSLREQNQKLATKYAVRGFPAVIILSPKGELVGRTGYQQGGARRYVKHLGQFIDPHREKNGIPAATAIQTEGKTKRGRPKLKSQLARPLARDINREFRTWTSRSGSSVSASVVEEKGSYVILKKEDGSTLQLLANKLSEADRRYISDLKQKN